MGVSVRISLATPEADLAAVVQPGVSTVLVPKVETVQQLETIDALITELERRRGIRPGTIEIRALIESPQGVTMANDIALSSPRLRAMGVGPHMGLRLADAGDGSAYASAEGGLRALASGLTPL